MFLDAPPQMIAKSSADRQTFIILFRLQLRKLAGPASIAVSGFGQVEDDQMKKLSIIAGVAAVNFAAAAAAHDTTTSYSSRGACEASSAAQSNAEKDWLLEIGMEFFDDRGDVSSFLTRAWTCDLNASDGRFYITDHVEEVLGSEWFQRRSR